MSIAAEWDLARFWTYAWTTLGFAACACLVLAFMSLYQNQSLWAEKLELVILMISPFTLIGWSWIAPWTIPADRHVQAFSLLKRILIKHMFVGRVALAFGGIEFIVSMVLLMADFEPLQGTLNWTKDLFACLIRFGLFAVLTDAAILLFVPSIGAAPSLILFYRRGLGITAAFLVGGLVLWSLATIHFVVQSAEALAGDEPYCIQVAEQGAYELAESLFSLSGLNMQAQYNHEFFGGYYNLHAVLRIGSGNSARLFNWSHRQRRFEVIPERYLNTTQLPEALCEPRPYFVRTLPWF